MFSNLTPSKNKLNLLQTFRGLAALLVVLHHASGAAINIFHQEYLLNFFIFGNSGVDFFFVLSGFLIFYIHASDIGNRNKFTLFIKKRFIRIYPIYWLVTIIVLPIYFIAPSFGQGYERDISVVIKSLLLYPQTTNMPIVAVGWSLTYEVFFYLMFSLLIILKPKLSLPIIASWIVGILISFTYNLVFNQNQNAAFFNIFSGYNLEFILGCLAALFIYKFKSRIKINYLKVFLGLSSVLFILGNFVPYGLTQESHVLIYGIPSVLIIISSTLIEIKNPLKIYTIFLYLGDASYSIYLTHYACLSALIKAAIVIKLNAFIALNFLLTIIIVITIILGCIFHSYIEKPLLTYLRQKWVKSGLE